MVNSPTSNRLGQHSNDSKAVRPSMDGERLIAVFKQLIMPIGQSLPSSSEVLLHDLSLLPNSIVAIYGDVTGRVVGDPATDLLLEKVSHLAPDSEVGYFTTLPDGRQIRSSTMIINDVSGQAVAALCINTDLSTWTSLQTVVDTMLGNSIRGNVDDTGPKLATRESMPSGHNDKPEMFVRSVDQLASHLIQSAIERVDVPVNLMHKRHKIEVVRDLRERGMFLLRDAVDMIATSLDVTRFTIYNYLKEIGDDTMANSTSPTVSTADDSETQS